MLSEDLEELETEEGRVRASREAQASRTNGEEGEDRWDLLYLLFYRRAQRAMPKVRDWMNSNSWLVNIIVCIVFIFLIL